MRKSKTNSFNNSTIFSEKELASGNWISQSEAARIRGVTPQAIGRLIKKGRFRVLKIGEKVFLNRREVENYRPKPTGRPRKRRQ